MKLITGITEQPNQQLNLVLPDGSRVRLTLNFRVQQSGWFADLVWVKTDGTTFPITGLRVCTSPNILRKWSELLPFGLMVFTDKMTEPVTVKAFALGTSKMFLLDAADVQQVEDNIYSGL